jgi:lysophospholipase L1-like esterase
MHASAHRPSIRTRPETPMKTRLAAILLSALFPLLAAAQAPEPTPAPLPPAIAEAKAFAAAQAKLADWPQLGRYKSDNDALPANAPGRVVFFGDSITDAWTRNGGTFFPGKPYVNRGIGGQTTPQMLVRFRQDVVNLHPIAVVILAGTNDIAGNTGPSTAEMIHDNFRSMVDIAQANHIRVILSSVLPAADYPWKPGLNPATKIMALNRWLASFCRVQHITYLDYFTPMADAQGGMKPGISKDGVHPNAAGYAIMEPLAEAALASKPN